MNTIRAFFLQVLEQWYYPKPNWLQGWLERIWIPALYMIGLFQWGRQVRWGNIPLDMGDWSDITGPRILVLQDAVRRGLIPLHIQAQTGMKGVTDRFLSIPDVILSPQVLLLKFLDPGTFLLINLLLLYSIGFISLYLIYRKYHLSLAVFSVLFLLFMFNGHIVDHIFIGHATWMVYFIFPFFLLLALDLVEKPQGWKWVFQMVCLQLVIYLQGGFHHFVQIILFLFLLGVFTPALRRITWITVAFSIATNLYSILPVSLVSSDLNIEFLGGFTTLDELLRGLVTIVEPAKVIDLISKLTPYVGWWEYDYYISWLGLAFITGVLLWAWRKKIPALRTYRALLAPAIILLLFSIGRIYKLIFLLKIPMLTGERVGARFLVFPFLLAVVIAAVAAQRLLETRRVAPAGQAFFLGLFLVLFSDIQQHTELWGVDQLDTMVLPTPIEANLWAVANRPDPEYITMLILGASLSVISLAVLTIIYMRAQKSERIRAIVEK